MKSTRTWILVADGARARIVEYGGKANGLHAVEGMEFSGDHASTHDLVSDRQGRSYSSTGPGRSAIEPHSDPHRNLKTAFAQRLAAVLNEAAQQKRFDKLIVIAAPVALGDLRAELSGEVHALIASEIAQDLTKFPNAELAEHLRKLAVIH